MIGTAIALAIAGAAAAGGSVAGAVIGSRAAGHAAETQARAAERAAGLTAQTAHEALDWQKEMWNQIMGIQKPYQEAGVGALGKVSELAGGFVAPTDVTEQNDPGYQFRLAEGQKLLERSAAARGNLLTGGTAKALTRYGQDFASNEYANVYNRAMGEHINKYNEWANIAGVGQASANLLSSAGLQSATNQGNIAMSSAAQQNQALQNAAAARASGYVGGANALSQGITGAAGGISDTLLLRALLQQQGGTSMLGLGFAGQGLGG